MRTLKPLAIAILAILAVSCNYSIKSPDNRLVADVNGQEFTVTHDGRTVFDTVHLGLIADNDDLDTELSLKKVSIIRIASDDSSKAYERTYTYVNPEGKELVVVVRLYNDGFTFRYVTPSEVAVTEEKTWFSVAEGELGYPALIEPQSGLFAHITDSDLSPWRVAIIGGFSNIVESPLLTDFDTFIDSQFPHITTKAHELAMPVIYESGLQHMEDRPEVFGALPQKAQDVLEALPAKWDDIKLLAGYPGESAIIARRSGRTWYIGGINGLDEPVSLVFTLDRLGIRGHWSSVLFCDGSDESGIRVSELHQDEYISIPCHARGGFMARIETE